MIIMVKVGSTSFLKNNFVYGYHTMFSKIQSRMDTFLENGGVT